MTLSLRRLIPVAALALALIAPSTLLAQEGGGGGGLILTTTTTGPTTTVVGGIVLTVMLVKKNKSANLREHLEYNQVAAREAVAIGTGDQVADLATFFHVSPENVSEFAAVMTAEREALLPLISGEEISMEQATEFAQIVLDGMQAHPELTHDVARIPVAQL